MVNTCGQGAMSRHFGTGSQQLRLRCEHPLFSDGAAKTVERIPRQQGQQDLGGRPCHSNRERKRSNYFKVCQFQVWIPVLYRGAVEVWTFFPSFLIKLFSNDFCVYCEGYWCFTMLL